ncbi:adhesin, partial [Flavobacterium sp. ST-119]
IINTTTVSGCADFTSFELLVEPLPEPEISTANGSHTICVDFTTGQVLSDLVLDSGVTPDGHTYQWYYNGVAIAGADPSSGTYTATQAGSYTVVVTGPAPLNCTSQESAVFEVLQSGPAVAIGDGIVVSNAFSDNQTVTVLVEGYGEYQYSLYPEGPWQNSNVFNHLAAGLHTIYVRDVATDNPCDMLVLEGVSIIDYPNYFTPNGDGYHDYWNITGLDASARIY